MAYRLMHLSEPSAVSSERCREQGWRAYLVKADAERHAMASPESGPHSHVHMALLAAGEPQEGCASEQWVMLPACFGSVKAILCGGQ